MPGIRGSLSSLLTQRTRPPPLCAPTWAPRYDGQMFVKPPELLTRDRLLGMYETKPVLQKLKSTLIGSGVALLASSVLLFGLINAQTDEDGMYGRSAARGPRQITPDGGIIFSKEVCVCGGGARGAKNDGLATLNFYFRRSGCCFGYTIQCPHGSPLNSSCRSCSTSPPSPLLQVSDLNSLRYDDELASKEAAAAGNIPGYCYGKPE